MSLNMSEFTTSLCPKNIFKAGQTARFVIFIDKTLRFKG